MCYKRIIRYFQIIQSVFYTNTLFSHGQITVIQLNLLYSSVQLLRFCNIQYELFDVPENEPHAALIFYAPKILSNALIRASLQCS